MNRRKDKNCENITLAVWAMRMREVIKLKGFCTRCTGIVYWLEQSAAMCMKWVQIQVRAWVVPQIDGGIGLAS